MTQENPTQASTVVKELNEGDIIEVNQYANTLKVTHTGALNGEENAFIGVEFVENTTSAEKSMIVNQNSGRVYLSAGTTDKGEVTEINVIASTEEEEEENDDDEDENEDSEEESEFVEEAEKHENVTSAGVGGEGELLVWIETMAEEDRDAVISDLETLSAEYGLELDRTEMSSTDYETGAFFVPADQEDEDQNDADAAGADEGAATPMAATDGGQVEESADKWDLSQYGRGTELVLDKHKGTFVVVHRKTTSAGTTIALDVVGPDDEVLRLQKVSLAETYFDARPAKVEGGTIREKGGTTVVRNVDNIDDVRDFEVIGEDKQRLKSWIRKEFH